MRLRSINKSDNVSMRDVFFLRMIEQKKDKMVVLVLDYRSKTTAVSFSLA